MDALLYNGNCSHFIALVDVQLDCDEKTMVQPDVGIVCDSQGAIGVHKHEIAGLII